MSKTGGGRGTNQYAVRGVSQASSQDAAVLDDLAGDAPEDDRDGREPHVHSAQRGRATSDTITRSTGIEVPGWPGPLPGGGYEGLTAELDAGVTDAARALQDAYGGNIEVRFNSNRRSGGAFMSNGLGVGARLSLTRAEWEAGKRTHPPWTQPNDSEPDGDGGQVTFDVYAPAPVLQEPELADQGGPQSRYACPKFGSLDEALAWVADCTSR